MSRAVGESEVPLPPQCVRCRSFCAFGAVRWLHQEPVTCMPCAIVLCGRVELANAKCTVEVSVDLTRVRSVVAKLEDLLLL